MAPSSSLTITFSVSLFLLSLAGYYTTWHLLLNNAAGDLMYQLRDQGPHVLSVPSLASVSGSNASIQPLNSTIPLRKHYTGIPQLDYQLTVLVVFFWDQVSGAFPEYGPLNFHFASCIFIGWALLTLEGLRKGCKGKLVSWTGVWGLGVQVATWACVGPVWLGLQVLTSPFNRGEQSRSDVEVEDVDVLSVLPALITGFLVPTLLMGAPVDRVEGWERKQLWVAVWQAFPLWVSLSRIVFAKLLRIGYGRNVAQGREKASSIKYRRVLYAILLALTVVIQGTTLWMVSNQPGAPNLFTKDGFRYCVDHFQPRTMSPATKMGSIGEGAHLLLQWDEIVLLASMVVWSSALLFGTTTSNGVSMQKYKYLLLASVFLSCALPMGFTVSTIWLRDEIAYRQRDGNKKKQ